MKRFGLVLLTGSIFTLSALTSCAQSPSEMSAQTSLSLKTEADSAEAQAPQELAQDVANGNRAQATSGNIETNETGQPPQLIKTANLVLDVASVEESFQQVRTIVNAQQGDVIEMNDYGDRQRSINFTLRVPQNKLNATIDALTELGDIRSRSITTQDVSNELVDLQARISNARKSEAALQEIMSRSGEISDVLDVSRELSSVRQNIEQMAGRQKSLQTQVQYSRVTLSLQSAIASTPNKPSFTTQLATSWNEATGSVGNFTTDLLQLGLWLLVYSPYLAVLAGGLVLANKARQSAHNSRPSQERQ